MGVMKRLAGGGGNRIRTAGYGGSGDMFHVDFSMFVDRKGVMDRIDRKTLRILGGTGSYAMGAMRKKIRSRPASKKSRTVTVSGVACFVPPQGKVLSAETGKPVRTRLAALARAQMIQQQMAQGVGKPPHRGPSDLLRKHILFGVEADTETVVIGPEMFAKQPQMIGAISVPQLLERGGKEIFRGVGGMSFTGVYAPRPFVAPTLPIAQQKMAELIESVPL